MLPNRLYLREDHLNSETAPAGQLAQDQDLGYFKKKPHELLLFVVIKAPEATWYNRRL